MPCLPKNRQLLSFATLCLVAGFAWSVAAQEDSAPLPLGKTAKTAAEKPDPFVVPNGTPAELLKYIDSLKTARPPAENQEAVMDFIKKRSQALLTAAERILVAKPEADVAKKAVQYKLMALSMLQRLGDKEAAKKLEAFPAQLEKAGLKSLVWQVRCAQIGNRLGELEEMSDADYNKLIGEILECLTESNLDPMAADLARGAAMGAESADQTQRAIKAYQKFGEALAQSKEKSIVGLAAVMQGAARRLGLVGKKLALEGTTVEGKPFQWSKYKGKVVLVDFWATWCGPCRAEMPNIEKMYEAYHAKGFDVVGVSVDQDRKALDEFLEENKHPWTVLHDNTEAKGTDKSLSTYYGIIGIPQMILVGKDGNVVSLNARGEQLAKELEKLLGPAEEKEAKPAKDGKKAS